jgi:hypothetical protein
MVNRTMTFHDPLRRIAGLLKMSIDVRGENELTTRFRRADSLQPAESGMGSSATIEV